MRPDVFGQMRRHRRHQLCQRHDRGALGSMAGLGFLQDCGESIEFCDGGVKAKALDAQGHVVDRLMHGPQQIVVA